MSDTTFHILKGKFFYAQVLGKPRPNYDRTANEWTVDFEPDGDQLAELKKIGIADKLKRGKEGHPAEGRDIIRFRRKAEDRDGNEKTPPKIVDAVQKAWPDNKLIGNGSEGFIRFSFTPARTKGYKPSVTLMGLMVKNHVAYEGKQRGMFDEVAENGADNEAPWSADDDE